MSHLMSILWSLLALICFAASIFANGMEQHLYLFRGIGYAFLAYLVELIQAVKDKS